MTVLISPKALLNFLKYFEMCVCFEISIARRHFMECRRERRSRDSIIKLLHYFYNTFTKLTLLTNVTNVTNVIIIYTAPAIYTVIIVLNKESKNVGKQQFFHTQIQH